MRKRKRRTRRRRRGRRPRLWIQEAIEKPGALRATVKRKYGRKGFTKRGTIKVKVLQKLAGAKGKTGFRARMALTLRKLRRRRRR